MGKYDDMSPDELRERLVAFATLIQRLEEEGKLLTEVPDILEHLGDLRQMLFAYEVRCAAHLGPQRSEEEGSVGERDPDDPAMQESLRVVQEALERERELLDELEGRMDDEDEEEA